MEVLHRSGETIKNRYQVEYVLGQGGMGTTYSAIDLNNSRRVALKVVSLRQASNWKNLELFAREAKVLANLNHSCIPKYLNYFEIDSDRDRTFYLVQEFISGQSLAQLIEGGWHPTEIAVQEIAVQVLKILLYLHSLQPPIIHRDIKPQNIIVREENRVFLVDFGAVQAIYPNQNSFNSTFVGTLGYTAPEQFYGQVFPGSDLYSLGCSLLFLLTKKQPNELPLKYLKIDFHSQISVSQEFAQWLDKIIEPTVENRFQSAKEALHNLPDCSAIDYVCNLAPSKLENRFSLETSNTLFINLPSSESWQPKSLNISKNNFILTLAFGILGSQHKIKGNIADLSVTLIRKQLGDLNSYISCAFYDGNSYHYFGSNLSSQQQEKLVYIISDFIECYRDDSKYDLNSE